MEFWLLDVYKRQDVYIVARKKVASEPVLRDWAAVDAALRDLKECQYALTELGVELDRRIDGLKDDYNKNAQPLQNRIKRLEGDVKEYVDAHRAELEMCIRDRHCTETRKIREFNV